MSRSKRCLRNPLFAAAVLFSTSLRPGIASGQLVNMEHGPAHARLEFLLGDWLAMSTQNIMGEERTIRSRTTFAWEPGNVWLRGEATIRGLPGIDVHYGRYQLTWDATAGEVVQLWYDNQTAILFVDRGNWVDDKTLVLEGQHTWRNDTVKRKTVYRIESEDSYTREHFTSYQPSGVERQTKTRHVRVDRKTAASDHCPEAGPLDSLSPWIGSWSSSLDPKYHDHPMVKRFNPDLTGQRLELHWGVACKVVHVQIWDLDTPSPGEEALRIEGMGLYQPSDGSIAMAEFGSPQNIFHDGRYEVVGRELHRTYTAHFADGSGEFREIWRLSDDSGDHFEWITERRENGEWKAGDVIVDWRRDGSALE